MSTGEDQSLILRVESLSVKALKQEQEKSILSDVSFHIKRGQVKALIGSSGSGKTMIALAILGLLPENILQTAGKMVFNGSTVGKGLDYEHAELRGKKISMIFQEPQASLNPVFKIGTQLRDVIRRNQSVSKKEARVEAIRMLGEVGLAQAAQLYHQYPHQLSGGMAQRVLIALALSCQPSLLIADEPTTSLDATTQIQILRLLKRLQEKHKFAILLISHDLQVVEAMADSIVRLENGKIMGQQA